MVLAWFSDVSGGLGPNAFGASMGIVIITAWTIGVVVGVTWGFICQLFGGTVHEAISIVDGVEE